MPIQRVVSIVLRLFCIQWMITGVSYLFPLFSVWTNGYDERTRIALYLGPTFFIVISGVFWVMTPVFARVVTKGETSRVNISGLTRHDLYSFAFVLMGLNFVLTNFSTVLTHFYQFIVVVSQTRVDDPARERQFYDLARYALNFVSGGIALVYAGRISTKLISREQKQEKAHEADVPRRTVAEAADAPLP